MALVILLLGFPTKSVLAAEDTNTNTNTKFAMRENMVIVNGIIYDNTHNLLKAPYNYDGYEPVMTQEEKSREKTLSRFKSRLESAVFPKGKFTVNASAYTAAADECGKSDGITASGVKVKEERTLACPSNFPFGTKIKIDGMGTYVCEDRGGAIKNNHVDIYMETKKEAFAFGRRNLEAEVIN